MNDRTFILGLGHQKCGTTWLHKYLTTSNLFAAGHVKEHHVWDRLDIELLKYLSNREQNALRSNPSLYFKYFSNLMTNGKALSADITPSYSGLKSERLNFIKQNFSKIGVTVKAIILVREPLSRIKSAVRFNLDRKNFSEGVKPGTFDFEAALNQYYKSQHCMFRTQYQNIIKEAEKVFAPQNLYVGFYENMFEPDEIKRLSEYLTIEPKLGFAKIRVNQTKSPVANETVYDLEIKSFYKETYEYFSRKYPISEGLWTR